MDDLCWVWLKLAQWFWTRRFYKIVHVFSLFCNYLPLVKDRALHLIKLESTSPKDALCQVWLKLAQWFWRKRFFKFINVFSHFRNYLPLNWPFIWTNLNSLHPRILCAKFCWNWPTCSGEKDFNICQCIFAIS